MRKTMVAFTDFVMREDGKCAGTYCAYIWYGSSKNGNTTPEEYLITRTIRETHYRVCHPSGWSYNQINEIHDKKYTARSYQNYQKYLKSLA